MTTDPTTRKSLWSAALVAAAVCGCASRGNVELLEGRIRQQEDQLYALRRQLKSAEADLAASRRESEALRTQTAQSAAPAPEQIVSLARVEGVQISRLMSGGLDRDGRPGDDVLKTLIVPIDAHGDLVKAPGAVRLEVLDLSRNGPEQQLGVWEFPPEEAERLWRKGLFGSGYAFELEWKSPPQSSTVMLHARFTTTDGRQFDTSQEVRIDPPALAKGAPANPAPRPIEPARPPELLSPVSAAPGLKYGPTTRGTAPPFPAMTSAAVTTSNSRSAALDNEAETAGVVRLGDASDKAPPEGAVPASAVANPFEQTVRRPGGATITSDRWTESTRPTVR